MWLLNIALAIAAVAVFWTRLAHVVPPGDETPMPWWLLAAMFAVTEILVVHLRLGREALTVSMSEIPLVLGLISVSPGRLLTAQLVGVVVVLIAVRRQPAIKLVFNLASYALETCVALAVFYVLSPAAELDAGPAFVAAIASALVAAGCVFAAVSIVTRSVQRAVLGRALIVGPAVAIVSTCLALTAAEVLQIEGTHAFYLIVPVALLYATNRAYLLHRERGEKLEAINEGTTRLEGSLELEPAMTILVEEARRIFSADLAVAVSTHGNGKRVIARQGATGSAMVTPVRRDELVKWWSQVTDRGAVHVTPKLHRKLDPDGLLAARGIGEALIVPLPGEGNNAGVLLVGNPTGDVGSFDKADLKLLQALANHAAVTFDNARLVDRLQDLLRRQARNLRRRKVAEARARSTDERFRRAVLAMSDARRPGNVPTTVVEAARDLIEADFAALTSVGFGQEPEAFISQLDPAVGGRMDLPPSGCRLEELVERSRTMNPGPEVRVLEVPVTTDANVWGTLVVANVEGARGFTKEDRQVVAGLAAQAAVAIENAHALAREQQLGGELDAANVELRRAYDAKSIFLASISHELRVPLSSILIAAEVLDEVRTDSGTLEHVPELTARIKASGRHVLALFDDLLDLSRIESGHLDLRLQPVSMNQLMREVVDAMEPIAAGSGVGIELRATLDDPVIADPLRVRQVLFNLLTNALKFTEAGGKVTIEDTWTAEVVTVSVTDTGPGIAERDIERIFEPFERALPGTEGAGLGLPISRRIAELHGGALTVESHPGTGSTFTLTLPRKGAPQPRGLAQPSILVVEDMDDHADRGSRVRDMLRSQGFEAFGVCSSSDALASFSESPPDLVVIDLTADLDARLEVVRAMRDDPLRLHIPVLGVSGADDTSMAVLAKEAGCDDVAGPLGARSLARRVRRILEREYH